MRQGERERERDWKNGFTCPGDSLKALTDNNRDETEIGTRNERLRKKMSLFQNLVSLLLRLDNSICNVSYAVTKIKYIFNRDVNHRTHCDKLGHKSWWRMRAKS